MSAAFAQAAPLPGLLGGLLIGVAAALMLLGVGRVAGVSGIAARAAGFAHGGMPRAGAWAFLAGLPLGAAAIAAISNAPGATYANWPLLVVAGLFVGFGTRLGSGCTSGHGVCGISRLSQRSFVATAVFMAAGIATVAAVNAVPGQ